MSKWYEPRHGSIAFWPRKRAKKEVQRIRSWPKSNVASLLGLAGYKVGMTKVIMIDDTESPSKGMEKREACTIVEVPPVFVYGLRFYSKDVYGKQAIKEFYSEEAKKLNIKRISTLEEIKKFVEENNNRISDVFALLFIDPSKTTIGKKKLQKFEVAIGGEDIKKKVEFALSIFGKEVKAEDVFKEGEFVDVVAVTKGKGWQGPVKRFGVHEQRRKATGRIRHVGTLGPWHPARVLYTVPMAGQMGFHRRTEYNKRILKIASAEEITQKGGFKNYGVVKNTFILLKGSIPGPAKRLIRIRKAIRAKVKEVKKPKLIKVS
ncbi:MAG: 50S ribosomal protein L3 [Candidatus Micrarchaeia archaeon]